MIPLVSMQFYHCGGCGFAADWTRLSDKDGVLEVFVGPFCLRVFAGWA